MCCSVFCHPDYTVDWTLLWIYLLFCHPDYTVDWTLLWIGLLLLARKLCLLKVEQTVRSCHLGVWIVQWLECQTHDLKLLKSCQLISVPIPPHVTTVAHKRSWSFCWNALYGRLQLNIYTSCICGLKKSDTVNWCMVHRMCTKMASVSCGSFMFSLTKQGRSLSA